MIKLTAVSGILGMLLVFSSGCATKEYVRQQTDPLADRISKLEAVTASLKDCCTKAEASAKRAEAAAKKAQAAAEKSSKAFELQQRK